MEVTIENVPIGTVGTRQMFKQRANIILDQSEADQVRAAFHAAGRDAKEANAMLLPVNAFDPSAGYIWNGNPLDLFYQASEDLYNEAMRQIDLQKEG